MVILEAAAIGAAGYGVYRGGDAAVRKGKETHKEMKREGVRREQKSELASKSKERSSRLAKLASLRQGAKEGGANSSTTEGAASSNDDARHKAVMAKPRNKPTASKPKSRFPNPFKRKWILFDDIVRFMMMSINYDYFGAAYFC